MYKQSINGTDQRSGWFLTGYFIHGSDDNHGDDARDLRGDVIVGEVEARECIQ